MRVSGVPAQARVVVIGAGIVGNSMAYHLAQQGWKEIVLIDKGPFPNPGGSTGHASNFIFLTDHSKEMTLFTLDSVRQYKELGVFTQSGGVEVARTAERMDELKRRMASSKAWGIDAELVSPAEVRRLDSAQSRGAPDDQCRAGAALRRHRRRDQVPHHPRHGHQWLRAPARGRPRSGLLRPSADPLGPRRYPLTRPVQAVADRVALHQGRLR